MALQIVWTANAIEDYRRVVDYLLTAWSLKVASGFITTLEERLNTLSSFPNIWYSFSKKSGYSFNCYYQTQQILLPQPI